MTEYQQGKYWCWISAFGRPDETRITIISLGRSRIAPTSFVSIYYTPPISETEINNPVIKRWFRFEDKLCGTEKASNSAREYLDIDTYVKEGGFKPEQINKIVDNKYAGTPPSFKLAVEEFRKSNNNYEWFIWIENDCLFRSNWFDEVNEAIIEAERYYKVGIVMPCRTIYPSRYGDMDINKNYKFLTRKVGASHCWVIRREIMFSDKIDLSKFRDYEFTNWDDDFCKMIINAGYQNIVLRTSCVKHIGKSGLIMNKNNYKVLGNGGVGFVPDEKIMELYNQSL